ncbi:serine/threonine-protein kinase TBK1-like [Antedon mediterranea]|uniref:serine/threonine-protein kinase TBK1-like n=1 Tax=Antedon mediterranea TaxID=105859 RepID=UPI003AF869E6
MLSRVELRGTNSFIWCTQHAIGKGATATVYIGRNKKTGEKVAMKVFNNLPHVRTRDTQMRELEVVRKLKHKNIVDVIAIEEDHVSKQPVMVMELCLGGSLLQYLDKPANNYGLTEDEFIRALKDITDAMKYLRSIGVVHRDIKPGNIMIAKGDDSTHTYKLADFGVARQVEYEEEMLQSLCGTEEYLRPDVYGRAVLHVGGQTNYTKSIDLWSLGVTFFQTATGQLPFRPFGGRRNREMMHYLTTKKEFGVISGVQHDSTTGSVEWFRELPETCLLSRGFKPIITHLLANLLESSPTKVWTFDKLFECTDRILSMKRFDVFNTQTAEMLSVYIAPTETSVGIMKNIEDQTGISAMNQVLRWQNAVFDINKTITFTDLPKTQPETPLLLYSAVDNESNVTVISQTPKDPNIPSVYNLESDALNAKLCYANLISFSRVVAKVSRTQHHICFAANNLVKMYEDRVRRVDYKKRELHILMKEIDWKSGMLSNRLNKSLIFEIAENVDPSIGESKRRLGLIHKQFRIKMSVYEEELKPCITERFDKLKLLATKTFPHKLGEDICNEDDNCVNRLEVIVENVHEIYDQFSEDRKQKRLQYNEEQIHKMDKQKLKFKYIQGTSLLRDHCEPKLKKLHSHFNNWYRVVNNCMKSLQCVERDIEQLSSECAGVIRKLNQVELEVNSAIVSTNATVSSLLNALANELNRSQHQIEMLTKNLADADVSRLSVKKQSECEPVFVTRQIRVPKHIKEQFLSMRSDLKKTKQDISESATILEELRYEEDKLKLVTVN